jgi:HlyD family secretion protein
MIRKTVVSAILCALLVGGGWFSYVRMMAGVEGPQRQVRPHGGIPVDVVNLEPRVIQEVLQGYGTARAYREAAISTQVAGRIAEIREGLRVGSHVEAGELLVRVEATDYEQEVERVEGLLAQAQADLNRVGLERENLVTKMALARSDLEVAEKDHERIRKLVDQGVAAHTDLDAQLLKRQNYQRSLLDLERLLAVCTPQENAAQAQIRTRKSELEKARLGLTRTQIAAPFAGVIGQKNVEVGELVKSGDVLVRLVDLSRLEIPVELPASKIGSVPPGAPARLFQEMSKTPVAEGHVDRVAPEIDLASRTFRAFLVVEGADLARSSGLLRPGVFLTAEIDGKRYEDALAVPRSVFVDDNVFVVEEGVARVRRPTILGIVGNEKLIGQGLEPGQMVVASDLELMFDGRKVSANGAKPGAGGPPEGETPPEQAISMKPQGGGRGEEAPRTAPASDGE